MVVASLPHQARNYLACISTDEGWLYLAGLKDLFNGELVGYAMSERMTKRLVMQALFLGVSTKRPANGLILHPDRGSQYCAHDYQKLLGQFGMTASMSHKGDCWDPLMKKDEFPGYVFDTDSVISLSDAMNFVNHHGLRLQ